ncbi:MAG TPA: Holliday junction branch migration protein RuvA [Burkholderiaceae bacterium]|nr:Holliday junction branch migration protein RuvA [Burkholderiaceae bacterium]
MIGRLVGTIIEKRPPSLLLDVGGVGYEIEAPMSTFYGLPAVGEQATLLTHLLVREDAHQLFGFATAAERTAFRALIRISGVGARTALSVLSGLSVEELAQAVTLQQAALLTRIPGIGNKTAQRLLLELKGKLGVALEGPSDTVPTGGETLGDVLRALVALGYSEREAAIAVKGVPAGLGVSEGIRQALKSLAKS